MGALERAVKVPGKLIQQTGVKRTGLDETTHAGSASYYITLIVKRL